MAVRREYISDLYRNVLGREGSEGEISGWENAPDEQSVSNMFYGSPEYTSQHGGQASWQDVGGQITPTNNVQVIGQPNGNNTTLPTPQRQAPSPSYPSDGGGDVGGGVGGGGSAPSGLSASQQAVLDYYKKYLGRDPLAGDTDKWLSGAYGWGDQNNLSGIERGIQTSEEAARRRAATPTTSFDPKPYTGFQTGGNDYSAFNTARQQDPGKSAKDAFAYISNQAPPPPFSDKKAMANWFNTYIAPGMNSLGHHIISVNEDGFTYSNGEGTFFVDFGQNSGATPGSMLQRLQWLATPADDATRARYPTTSTGGGGGSTPTRTGAGTGGASTYGGPGGPGITKGPLQQVGQDPLSQLITDSLGKFIAGGGSTGFGSDLESYYRNMLGMGDGGGGAAGPQRVSDGGIDQGRVNSRAESARELLDKGRRTMINDLEGDLVSKNLLSEPGIPQGAHIGGLERVTENIAPEFSRALRDIYTDESAKADTRQLAALQMATGFSTEQARNLLAGIGEGTARQTALGDLALRELQTNMAWNQFLAQFGLQRDQVMYQIQNGGIDQLLPLLQAFIQQSGLSNAGYVGSP